MKTQTQFSSRPMFALATLALAIATALPAQAQNFEAHYGEASSRDQAEDVRSVNFCPGGGAITVGTRSDARSSEVLITRVDDVGLKLWQRSYRIGDLDFSSANGVIEYRDGSGFAITGSAVRGDARIFAMRISCEGKPQWTVLLDNAGSNHRAVGHDLLELPATTSTMPTGDLIVLGDERVVSVSGTTIGRVARIGPAGNVIFDNAYLQPGNPAGLRFRALTLARANGGALTDLVIAGSAGGVYPNWNYDRRGLMFRLDINGNPQCNALLGSNDSPSQDYLGVNAVNSTAAFAGQTILVGATSQGDGNAPQLPYLTRFASGTCVPLRQAHWPFPGERASAQDSVAFNGPIVGAQPRFAVTGSVQAGLNQSDGFVAWANVGTLAPFLPTQRFGVQQVGAEALRAMDVKGDRLLLAGDTNRDWSFLGDTGNAYLVQTDPISLRTQCSLTWTIQSSNVDFPYERFEPAVVPMGRASLVETRSAERSGAGYCCGLNPN